MLENASRTWLFAILITLIWAAGVPAADEPKLIGNPVVLIDRVSGTGKAAIYFFNSTNAELTISLGASVPSATKTARMKILFSETEQGPGSEVLNHVVKKGSQAERVWALVTDAWDVGDIDIDLVDKDANLGTLKIRRLPFTVKLDGPSPDKAELLLVDGVESRIILKNDDPAKYRVAWRLFLAGSDVCAGKVDIEPTAIAELRCTPKVAFDLGQLLKDDSRDGHLLLTEDTKEAQPLRAFPVKATVSGLGPSWRASLGYVLIVVILIIGGICSLLLSQFMPNRLQRLNIQDQLDAIARTTADLSDNVDSRLAVQIRIERLRLNELLRSRTVASPDFADILAQCTQGIAQLTSRVRLLQQMNLVLARREALTRLGVAPTLVDQVDGQIGKAVVLLGKTEPRDADSQDAAAAVASAAALVDTLIQPGVEFGQSLGERIKSLVDDIKVNCDGRDSFERLTKAAPGPWRQVQAIQAGQVQAIQAGQVQAIQAAVISSDQYTSLDMAVAKLLLIQDYVMLLDGTTDPDLRRDLEGQEASLTKYLQLASWEALRRARLLVREIRDGVYPGMLREAVEKGQAVIRVDPAVAYDRASLRFRVRFQHEPWNTAAAREELTCHWEFGDGLKATGWEVTHYYELPHTQWRARCREWLGRPGGTRQPGAVFDVTASFHDEKGKPIVDPNTKDLLTVKREVSVRPTRAGWTFGERAQMEYLKLAAALLIAVFALVTGAKDQLAKLDVLPGLVAVFLVGFGADTIKNLLTNK
jgi:hypothetical protein